MKSILTNSGKFSVFFAILTLLAVSAFGQPGSGPLKMRRALDFDNDGKADFSVFRPNDNVWYILQSGGGILYQTFGLANEDYMAPGDYDGDGKADISIFRDTNGVWWRLNSSNNTASAVQFGIPGDEPVQRDYDGDGKTDQAVVRRSNGAIFWYVLRSSDLVFYGVQFGLAGDYTAPGDYDGDGKFDFATQRPGATATDQATWYIQRSSDLGYSILTFGLSNDLVVPGDYDGDGKTDVATLREGPTPTSQMLWSILPSSNIQSGGYLVAFGITGTDYNVQADYDGDGKTDIATWRDSEGNWYILRSSDGVLASLHWGSPSDFPLAAYDTH